MKKILIPFFEVNGTGSYPSNITEIHGRLTFQSTEYYIATGEESAQTGAHTYADYEASLIIDPIKMVSMGKFGELLPDAVLIELEDFKNTTSTVIGKRKASARVLTRINSNVSVDVLHADFQTLLTQLVTHTSLTGIEAIAILAELKS